MLSNAYFLAKFRFDTAENEPAKKLQKYCKIFANFANLSSATAQREDQRICQDRRAMACSWPKRPGMPREPSHQSVKSHLCRVGQRRPVGKISANLARFRLYRHGSLQENTRFAAFFKFYQIIKLNFLKFGKSLQICHIKKFCKMFAEFCFHENC